MTSFRSYIAVSVSVCLNRRQKRLRIERGIRLDQKRILAILALLNLKSAHIITDKNLTCHEVRWESFIERRGPVDGADLLGGQPDAECFHVREEVFDFAPPKDGKRKWSLVHDIRDSN